jgi:hypothetical protein
LATQLNMPRNLEKNIILKIDFLYKFEKPIEFVTLNKDKIVNKI